MLFVYICDILFSLTSPARLNLNTVTIEHIENKIKSESFTILPSGKTMVCELILENGFSVRGDASVVDVKNFDKIKGEEISRRKAIDSIWALEGYLLQERLFNDS